jgi:hypothetical protein
MARKYEIGPDYFAWNLEQCEEVVLIATFEETKKFIPPGEIWQTEFENHFFIHGNGIAQTYIDQLNAVRRRHGLDRFELRETDLSDYGRTPNKQFRSETRNRIRQELREMPTNERIKRIERANAEIQILPAPHYTYEQWKQRRDQYASQSRLSREEIARRNAALAPPPPPPRPKSLDAQKALTMLKFASKPDIIQAIIGKLSADDALEMLPEIENENIRDELIRHSLEQHS